MANEILTPKFRAAFLAITSPSAGKNDDGTPGAPKYSVKAVFEPDADLSALKAAAGQAATDKWGTNIPKNLRSPFRKNVDLDKPVVGMSDDAIVMTFSAKESSRPGLVDASLNDIIDPSKVYSGAYFRAQVRPFCYENAGNKGVSFGLQNVQFLADGEPLGGRVPANKAFDAIVAPAGAAATSLFD